MEQEEWQIDIISKDGTCTFFDNQLPSIHVIEQVGKNWFKWNNPFLLVKTKEFIGEGNIVHRMSRLHLEGIEIIDVEFTLLPARKEII